MKKSIHPKYNQKVTITCNSCKTKYEVGSTAESLAVEVCANCHPHYTGKSGQLVDTQNMIKNYMKRLEAANQDQVVRKKKKNVKRKSSKTDKIEAKPKVTLKDMLKQVK